MNDMTATARCPECGVARDPEATSCLKCGLLFVTNAHPRRRESDLQRRTEDLSKTSCRVCRGTIEKGAKRCLHCGEILDSAYRADRARQLRTQINYASWIAYILGFLMLFVFRPVGVLAIIAGLLLSIAYYAVRIPDADDDSEKEEDSASNTSTDGNENLTRFLRRQFGVEKVRIGSSRKRSLGLVVAGTPLLLAAIGWATNYSMLQIPIDQALSSKSDFPILEIAAHYEYFVIPNSVVLEIEKLGDPANAERALERIARQFSADEVEIRFGDHAVTLDGDRFRDLSRLEIEKLVRTLYPAAAAAPAETPKPSRQVRIPLD